MSRVCSERRSFTILCLRTNLGGGDFGEVGDHWLRLDAASGDIGGYDDEDGDQGVSSRVKKKY